MTTILQPFATTAPAHVLALFFMPENERNRLTTHMYGENNQMRQRSGVVNCHLIDCIEQPLKSVHHFRQVANVYLNTALANYLEKYVTVTPGD